MEAWLAPSSTARNGTLTITAYDSTTGVATYTYQLTSPTTDGPGPETEVFTLTTSDGTATSAPATITIEIIDDLPNAVDDFDSIGKDDASAHTGNVFTNDLHPNGEPGADVPATSIVGRAAQQLHMEPLFRGLMALTVTLWIPITRWFRPCKEVRL